MPRWTVIKQFLHKVLQTAARCNPITRKRLAATAGYIRRSWKSLAIIIPAVLLLYYLVGSWATHRIDKNIDFEINRPQQGLAVVNAATGLIRREVDDHLWTPNLPFIFPGYILDNMPAFQLGLMRSVRMLASALSSGYDSPDLNKAVELLEYPGNIWLLSKTENLALAPSSGAQYRKARKALQKFNESLPQTDNPPVLVLHHILQAIEKNAVTLSLTLETQVREESNSWVDNQADNLFYAAQGQLYADYVILKALAADFKQEILDAEQYEVWTLLTKTLEDALAFDPAVVRNGRPDSALAPNHLLTLNYYIAKTCMLLNKLAAELAPQ